MIKCGKGQSQDTNSREKKWENGQDTDRQATA